MIKHDNMSIQRFTNLQKWPHVFQRLKSELFNLEVKKEVKDIMKAIKIQHDISQLLQKGLCF